jgi:predicted transcriptional regulator
MEVFAPQDNAANVLNQTSSTEVIGDRREEKPERRKGDRRVLSAEESGYTGPDRRESVIDRRTGLERRRGPGIRREEDRKNAEEGEFSDEQLEFVMAIETYKKVNKRMFPTWTEVLEVIRQLGYRKVEARSVNLNNVPEPELHKKSA